MLNKRYRNTEVDEEEAVVLKVSMIKYFGDDDIKEHREDLLLQC